MTTVIWQIAEPTGRTRSRRWIINGDPYSMVWFTCSGGSPVNPFLGNYQTSDGGTIDPCIVSRTRYLRDTFEHMGIPEAADDSWLYDVLSDGKCRAGKQFDRSGERENAGAIA